MPKTKGAALLAQTRPLVENPLEIISTLCDRVKLNDVMQKSKLTRSDLIRLGRDEFPLLDKSSLAKGMNPERYGVVIHPHLLELMANRDKQQEDKPPVNQCNQIIWHCEEYGSITALEAINYYQIMHLASRISELRKRGYQVEVVTEKGCARYILHKEAAE